MIAYINIFYLVSAVCFILGIKRLSHPKTARSGNSIAAIGMLVAIITVLYQEFVQPGHMDWSIILIGMMKRFSQPNKSATLMSGGKGKTI